MKKLKDFLGSAAALIYFIFPMCFIMLILVFMPIGFITDVSVVRKSGFAGQNIGTSFISMTGFFIGLSLLISPLRKMYRVLPWLYSFIKIFFINLVIISIGLSILNVGYQVRNTSRHTIFFILMIAHIVICRIGMCIYFKLRPVRYIDKEVK